MKKDGKGFMSMAICVDFDGVIAEFSDDIEDLGRPIPGGAEAIRALKDLGYKIIVHTARPSSRRHMGKIEKYLAQHKIPYDEINKNSDCPWKSVKPLADLYIDDRGLRFNGDWKETVEQARMYLHG